LLPDRMSVLEFYGKYLKPGMRGALGLGMSSVLSRCSTKWLRFVAMDRNDPPSHSSASGVWHFISDLW